MFSDAEMKWSRVELCVKVEMTEKIVNLMIEVGLEVCWMGILEHCHSNFDFKYKLLFDEKEIMADRTTTAIHVNLNRKYGFIVVYTIGLQSSASQSIIVYESCFCYLLGE